MLEKHLFFTDGKPSDLKEIIIALGLILSEISALKLKKNENVKSVQNIELSTKSVDLTPTVLVSNSSLVSQDFNPVINFVFLLYLS